MIGLLIYKYEPFWQEVSVKYLLLRWSLRPVASCFFELVISACLLVFFAWNLETKCFFATFFIFNRSFNIQSKFNRNSILCFQLIEISPHSLSTTSHMWKMAEEGLECISLENSLGNPFSDWLKNMNIQKAVNCLHSACWFKKKMFWYKMLL